MTYAQFVKQSACIRNETFQFDSFNPFSYAIQRNAFQRRQYQRLIDLAERAPGLTAKRKLSRWKRELKRLNETRERLEKHDPNPRIVPLATLRREVLGY
jgi:hypothetical protein